MQEIGKVLSVSGKKARVLINRHAACGDCGACQIGREKMTMETDADNPIGAKTGEDVLVEMQFVSVLQATAIAYGLPLLALLAGAFAGWAAAPGLGLDQVLTAFFAGLVCVALCYAGIAVCERHGCFHTKYRPVITALADPDAYAAQMRASKAKHL